MEQRPEKERKEWLKKEEALLGQDLLFGEKLKPIAFPEMRFKVQWRCDDPRCQTHDMALLQWGIHELYRKLTTDPERNQKLLDAMHRQLDLERRDAFFFLGNFRDIQYNFGLMDSYSPERRV